MKTMVLTGVSGNLGRAVLKKFLAEGYSIAGTVTHNDPAALDVRAPEFEKTVVDLTNEEETKKFVDSVVAKNGSIDVAVLTVGGFAMGKIADTKTTDILKQYKLNFETAYNLVRPVFTQMLKQNSGRIFLVGSRAGSEMRHSKGMVAYGLTKSLIFRLAEIMNDEAKDHNVVTSVVVPSVIDSPQNRKAMPDADFSKWVKPEAIAEVILFYCSEEAALLREPVIKVYGVS